MSVVVLGSILAVFAAIFQTVRNSFSKSISNIVNPNTVSFARFGFALPFVMVYFLILLYFFDLSLGDITNKFWLYIATVVFSHTLFNTLLVYLFNLEFFTICVALSKLETIFTAIFGLMIFGVNPSVLGWIAVLGSIIGVLLVSFGKIKKQIYKIIFSKQIFIGLLIGVFGGIAILFVSHAISSIHGGDVFLNAAFTLLVVLSLQSFGLLIYILISNKKELMILCTNFKQSFMIGISGALASICWFLAFAILNPAYVKTVGSVEMIFTLLVGYVFFKDRLNVYEYAGIFLIILSAIGILYA